MTTPVARDQHEADLARAIAAVGAGLYALAIAAIQNGDPLGDAWWAAAETEYIASITPALTTAANSIVKLLATTGPTDIDWTALHDRMADWARQYTYELVGGIDETSRTALQDLISSYIDGKAEYQDVVDKLGDVFGPQRAATIAETEITRATTQGQNEFEDELRTSGYETESFWEAQPDACGDICAPLDGKARGDGWEVGPPDDSHPRCKCGLRTEIVKAA